VGTEGGSVLRGAGPCLSLEAQWPSGWERAGVLERKKTVLVRRLRIWTLGAKRGSGGGEKEEGQKPGGWAEH
jgi:hypothetical protein